MSTDLERLKNPDSVAALGADSGAATAAMGEPVKQETKPTKAVKTAPKPRPVKAGAGRFIPDRDGVYYVPEDGDKRKICGALNIIAQVRNIEGNEWAVLVKLTDLDGIEKEHVIPRFRLVSDQSSKVVEELAAMGLWFSYGRDTKPLLLQYLQTSVDAPRARLIPSTGWHNGAFVLPAGVIGETDEVLIYSGKLKPPVGESGTLEAWRDGVARYAVGNPLFLLILSAGFAGALLRLTGMDSGGFHVSGDSKAGKSTICDMAASIYGTPKDYRQTWHGTATGIEYTSAAFNDLPLVLDEIGQGDPKAVDTVVYMLSQGKGKARGRDTGGLREATRWCCFLLSNGEHDLATYLQMGGKEIKAGQAVRLMSLQARRLYGAFDELHGFNDAPALCAQIATAAQANHGTAGAAFLARLAGADHAEINHQLREALASFASACIPANASPQVRHAAQYFGLAAFAGWLATSYGLTGWSNTTAWDAAKVMFADWIQQRGGAGNEEDKQILQQVRYFFEQNGMARFHPWSDDKKAAIEDHSQRATVDDHSPKTLNMCGYRRTIPEYHEGLAIGEKSTSTTYYVDSQSWCKVVLAGKSLKRANKLLLELGILDGGGGGKAAKKVRMPMKGGNPVNVYVVTPKLWAYGDDESE